VVGLYLLAHTWRALLVPITIFTLAHSCTLALASLGFLRVPASVVEPLIALSIVAVAIENILCREPRAWRGVMVAGFGLLHGLGFAGVLGDLGLPEDRVVAALFAFNLGVEGGQLAVIGLLALGLWWWRERPWYRRGVVVPGSAAIALIGLWWTVERLG
jgi:hypothetical protein